MKREAGFTLIEVIVSLILVGILVAVGGMAVVQAVRGYILTRDNAAVTQKAQLAIARITREIVEMTDITANASASSIPIKNIARNVTIGLDAGAIKIAQDGVTLSAGDMLLDNVTAFTLTYYSGSSVISAPTTTYDIRNLTAIDVNIQVALSGGGTLIFADRISPRNNKNQGGTVPSSPPPTAPSYGAGCFVATAAYGDAAHPMVVLLREFRDRFLLPWSGGRWFAKQYDDYGPRAADMIRNRPPATWAARCLLAPIAALTFLILYAPLAIPFLLLSAWVITGAFFSTGARRLPAAVFHGRGSILIGLIITMVIMATLGAAMLPMFSASYMNQVFADQGRKAYFLAESGFRYAASLFLNAGTESAKLTVLTANVNNRTFNLSNGGSFTTIVYPYWFRTQSVSGTTLTAQIPGTMPPGCDLSSGGYLQIDSVFYSFSSGSGSGATATLNGLSPTPSVASGRDVLPVVLPSGSASVTNGGNLTLSGTGVSVLPLLNGNFTLNPTPSGIAGGTVFNYEKRTGNTLSNITLSDPTKTWINFTVNGGTLSAATRIVLDKFLQLSSTGNIGGARRGIIYNVPVGWMAGGGDFSKQQFQDRFASDANWYTAQAMGTYATNVGGSGAMQVTSVVNPAAATGLPSFLGGLLGWGSSSGFWGFNAFNWGSTNTNLAQSWLNSGGCLSYDLQIKVKNTGPYFMAGLGFRMRNNSDSSDLYEYGVSFLRARQTRTAWWSNPTGSYSQNSDMPSALIPPGLYPSSPETSSVYACGGLFGLQRCQDRYSNPAIILWQRTGPSTGTGAFKLLAYCILTTSDGVLTGTSPAFRLKDWSTLMVRVIEGYSLTFTGGRNDTSARHLKYGDSIRNAGGTKTARVIGTPIVSSGSWASNSAAGTMILSNVSGSFTSGEAIYIDGGSAAVVYANAGAQSGTKANYVMVYYSDDKTAVAGNTVQADNTRIGNARESVNWPPDDWTDRTAGLPSANPPGNDYFTLIGGPTSAIQWTSLDNSADGQGNSASYVNADSSTDLYKAVIKTDALITAPWTTSSVVSDFAGDAIALVTSGCTPSTSGCYAGAGSYTYYDDFGIQLDTKSGTGFLPPIQQ